MCQFKRQKHCWIQVIFFFRLSVWGRRRPTPTGRPRMRPRRRTRWAAWARATAVSSRGYPKKRFVFFKFPIQRSALDLASDWPEFLSSRQRQREARSRPRGRRRRRSWRTDANRSTSTTWVTTNWGEQRLWLQRLCLRRPCMTRESPAGSSPPGTRPRSCGSGCTTWRPWSTTTVSSSRGRDTRWVTRGGEGDAPCSAQRTGGGSAARITCCSLSSRWSHSETALTSSRNSEWMLKNKIDHYIYTYIYLSIYTHIDIYYLIIYIWIDILYIYVHISLYV